MMSHSGQSEEVQKVDTLIREYVRLDQEGDHVTAGRIMAELEEYRFALIKDRVYAIALESSERITIENMTEIMAFQKRLGDLKHTLWVAMMERRER